MSDSHRFLAPRGRSPTDNLTAWNSLERASRHMQGLPEVREFDSSNH